MKITAFAGSNSRQSINKQLLQFALRYFDDWEITLLDLNDFELPVFGVDLEREIGIPKNAIDFANHIDGADLLVVSLAEHNGAYSAVFKNTFDWISRISGRKAFGMKPMFLMATSDGGRGGTGVLEIAAKRMPFSGGNVLATFSLPSFYKTFSPEKGILSDESKTAFEDKIALVKQYFNDPATGNTI